MAASVLSVRVDSSIKDSFAELCEELGMTSSVAVNTVSYTHLTLPTILRV